MPTAASAQDHYAVLGVRPDASAAEIHAAYRRALLVHHPDKASPLPPGPANAPPTPTALHTGEVATQTPSVDAIRLARDVLGDNAARREFDRARRLGLDAAPVVAASASGLRATELATVDLDDMGFDEDAGVWFRGCRCGNLRAYEVSEADLAREPVRAEGGEVVVGCAGCSLHLRVLFSFAAAEGDEGNG